MRTTRRLLEEPGISMRKLMVVALVSFLLAPLALAQESGAASPAVEGWRATRWGMTEDEVLAAMPDARRVTDPERAPAGIPSLEVPGIDVGSTVLTAKLFFNDGRLVVVGILATRLNESDPPVYNVFDAAETALIEKYGRATNNRREGITREALWVLGPTTITLTELSGNPQAARGGFLPRQPWVVSITYKPRAQSKL